MIMVVFPALCQCFLRKGTQHVDLSLNSGSLIQHNVRFYFLVVIEYGLSVFEKSVTYRTYSLPHSVLRQTLRLRTKTEERGKAREN